MMPEYLFERNFGHSPSENDIFTSCYSRQGSILEQMVIYAKNRDSQIKSLKDEYNKYYDKYILDFEVDKHDSRYLLSIFSKNVLNRFFEIDKVKFSGPATIVFWKDGTKTVVKKKKSDKTKDDREAALSYAYNKKLFEMLGIKSMDKHLAKLVKNAEVMDNEKEDKNAEVMDNEKEEKK